VGRADEFADFASLPSSSPPSGDDEEGEGDGEDEVVGGGGEEEEAERSREEMIEERKDQFFKFVDLPSGKRVMVFKYKDRFYASNAVPLSPHTFDRLALLNPVSVCVVSCVCGGACVLCASEVVPTSGGGVVFGRRGGDSG
jgi:hypothetical protein